MRPAVVAFDPELLLHDAAAVRTAALERACADEGIAASPTADQAWHEPDEAAAAVLGAAARHDPVRVALLARRFDDALATALAAGVRLRDGAVATLTACAALAPLAVVSRWRREVGAPMLALAGLAELVTVTSWRDDVASVAPSPAGDVRVRDRLRAAGRLARAAPVALVQRAAEARAAGDAGFVPIAIGHDAPPTEWGTAAHAGAFDDRLLATIDMVVRHAAPTVHVP